VVVGAPQGPHAMFHARTKSHTWKKPKKNNNNTTDRKYI
jgi:hypothetical protein